MTGTFRLFVRFAKADLTAIAAKSYQPETSIFFTLLSSLMSGNSIPRRPRLAVFAAAFCLALGVNSGVRGQQMRFPQYGPSSTTNPWNPTLNAQVAPAFTPGIPASGWPSSSGSLGPATISPLGAPTSSSVFPGASNFGTVIRPNSSPVFPTPAATPNYSATGGGWNLGSWLGLSPSPYPSQPYITPAPTFAPGSLGNTYPSSVYPNASPPALFPGSYPTSPSYGAYGSPPGQGSIFPNSIFNGSNWRMTNGWFNGNSNGPLWNGNVPLPTRFFVTPRFRHSWIYGDDDPDSVGINDTDASAVFQIPGFLGSTQPLYIVPSYSHHLWDGPSNGVADLPGNAYSAFLDFGWETNPLRTFGTELGVRVGVFSDFNTFNSESLRILGKVLGRIRLTPNATLRVGAYWLDRNRIKLLPAAGILWSPNPDTRFDIFFPEPKLSHYVATLGSQDIWWYVSGYYGGGAWTIERADGSSDNIDINDIRLVLGVEWGRNELIRQGHRFAFFEGGYVFNRELIYRIRPMDNLDIKDSFMIRAGFVY
jgi:hypothetical protein